MAQAKAQAKARTKRKGQRPKGSRPWRPLVDVTERMTDEFLAAQGGAAERSGAKLLRVWQSDRYEVYEASVSVPGWPGGEVTWLSIKRLDKGAVHDWRHLQWVKNDVCGSEREAIELYPAESRLVDTSNQYHLWVLGSGHRFPFGYEWRAVVAADASQDRYTMGQARQRPFPEGMAPADAIDTNAAREAVARLAAAIRG